MNVLAENLIDTCISSDVFKIAKCFSGEENEHIHSDFFKNLYHVYRVKYHTCLKAIKISFTMYFYLLLFYLWLYLAPSSIDVRGILECVLYTVNILEFQDNNGV